MAIKDNDFKRCIAQNVYVHCIVRERHKYMINEVKHYLAVAIPTCTCTLP